MTHVWLEDTLRPIRGALARSLPADFQWCRLTGLDPRVGDILHIERRPGLVARLFGQIPYAELVVVTEIDTERVYLWRGYGASWVRSFPKGARVTVIGVDS